MDFGHIMDVHKRQMDIVNGLSITHGNPRQHIWTFANGAYMYDGLAASSYNHAFNVHALLVLGILLLPLQVQTITVNQELMIPMIVLPTVLQ